MQQRWYINIFIICFTIFGYAQMACAEERPMLVALEASTDLSPTVSAAMDDAVRGTTDPFAKGMRYWSITAGASRDTSIGTMPLTQININQYVAHRLALVYGGMFGYINAQRTPAGVLIGPDLGLRWQWIAAGRWSTYLEGLVGAVWQTEPLTEQSLRFNFDLQPGTGATYRLNERTLVQGGFRWHHLSNARVRGKDHNLGYDGPMLYVELLKTF